MADISSPVIYEVKYNQEFLSNKNWLPIHMAEQDRKYLLQYPTVYIVNDKGNRVNYSVYVGETTNIMRRTREHLKRDSKNREDWERFSKSKTAEMFIIGHDRFNKSLTLDIENRLMQYMSSVPKVKTVHNRRSNLQSEYYTSDKLDKIFSKIWLDLRKRNKELFPVEQIIRDSAIFKASPFHKLTTEQFNAREDIILRITEALNRSKENQLILVEGEAGSGKTVLMSSLFYELSELSKEGSENAQLKNIDQHLLVNHEQQLTVYKQIADKLGMINKGNKNIVAKPTTFINRYSPDKKADVVIVDEAHLLWTQGKQGYHGKNQLKDLMERAKVVVAIFDENQILSTEQYWEEEDLRTLKHEALLDQNYIKLENQLRINAEDHTLQWIRSLIHEGKIHPIIEDIKGYDLKIFDRPEILHKEIVKKAKNEDSGISRITATFDWEYSSKRESEEPDKLWKVKIGDWELPWNLQVEVSKEEKRKNNKLAWAEQAHTIGEVGSTFTVQGFDLNYAGVIIGPSVKYRNGEIIFDREGSMNRKAKNRRTLKNGEAEYVAEKLLKNELNVLLTRGVNGLYIYAVDDELREALLKAQGK